MQKKELFESDTIFACALNEIPDMLRIIDKDGNVLYANKAFVDRFGNGLGEVCHKIPSASEECSSCTAVECIKSLSRQDTVLNVRGRVYSLSTNPVSYEGQTYALEILSDITLEANLKDRLVGANERMISDLEVARSLQLSILRNELPSIDGYDFAAEFLPCEALGGDMYDCFLMRDGRVFMYIADVSGHGVMPAMLTVYLRQEMFAQCKKTGINPKQVLSNMQDSFEELSVNPSIYITIFAVVLEPETGKFVYCNAGHSVTPLIASEKETKELFLPGTPICRWTNAEERSEKTDTLKKGERLLLYTDGLDDVHVDKAVAEELGVMLKDKARSNQALLDNIKAKFAQKKEDDVTMLVCERR